MNKQKMWKVFLIIYIVYFADVLLGGVLYFYPQMLYEHSSFYIRPLIFLSTVGIVAILFNVFNFYFLAACFLEKRINKILILIPLLYLIGQDIPSIVASIVTGSNTVTRAWDDVSIKTQAIFGGIILPLLLLFLCIFFIYKNRFWKKEYLNIPEPEKMA